MVTVRSSRDRIEHFTVRWPRQAGGRRIQGHYHGKVVGTLQKWPAKAGGRSPKGPAVAGATVFVSFVKIKTSVIIAKLLSVSSHKPMRDQSPQKWFEMSPFVSNFAPK